MNKVAQDKARSAVEFLSSVDPDVLREIHPGTRERLLTKLTEAFPRKAHPSRIEAEHPAIIAAELAPFEMETEEERAALATAMMSGPPIRGHVVTANLLERAAAENAELRAVLRDAFNDIRDTWEGSEDTETMELLTRIGAVLGGLTDNHHLLPISKLDDARALFVESLVPVMRASKPTAEEVAAWGREFEASAVVLRRSPPPEVPDAPPGESVDD